jgi:hypothetical protein
MNNTAANNTGDISKKDVVDFAERLRYIHIQTNRLNRFAAVC